MVTYLFLVFLWAQSKSLAVPEVDNEITDLQRVLKSNLTQMNSELLKLNLVLSDLSWKLSTQPSEYLASKVSKFGAYHIKWRSEWCFKLNNILIEIYGSRAVIDYSYFSKKFEKEYRQFYLLCRGPVYNSKENSKLVHFLSSLESIYETSKVCLDDGTCLRGEPDLERIMSKSRDPEVLLWAWTQWRNKVGPPSRAVYPALVNILNQGAKNNGYNEIGECWREEMEVNNLEKLVEDLYTQIEPLYSSLHAVVRFKLSQYYGSDVVSLNEPIPAHLLGNMWAQNWGSLLDIIIDVKEEESLTYYLKKRNYTITEMVKKAEDFFVSLGFQPMTENFWKFSKLQENAENGSTCHGTAANMFKPNDFRIILCAEVNEEDFSVIHHEMGHIEYYKEYENQPTIFQDGVNSAFQESIGDAVMLGVVSSAHLQRLGVIPEVNQNSDSELKLLLHQALVKIPQIPFSLLLEKWRWNVFKGIISPSDYNKSWWVLKERYQGVRAPVDRTEKHFDPSAKFHINDNKPYVRYFLSSVLQMQIFEAMCKAAIYGENYKIQTLPFPLYKCDIYGSKTATENLRKVMSQGSSILWKDAMKIITGEESYSARPLLEYFQPLYEWLQKEIRLNNIPVGWNVDY